MPYFQIHIKTSLHLEVTPVKLNSEISSEQVNVRKKGEWLDRNNIVEFSGRTEENTCG